mmetsp:Transcript_17286/g.31506  ORF Transcript_17286/g.31506 Transcript_17286/m.31506 type:complete len:231 (+) Transcript_17286:247-939(+)
MAQKTHPIGFRLGITKQPQAHWYAHPGVFHKILRNDARVLQVWNTLFIESGLALQGQVVSCNIMRQLNLLQLTIKAGIPAILMKNDCEAFHLLKKQIKNLEGFTQCRVKLIKVADAGTSAIVIARQLADSLEKRVNYKRAMKQAHQLLENSIRNSGTVNGFKIRISGRLNGSEIARPAWIQEGRLPLQSLSADIDYATLVARTTYGALGLKIWVYSGKTIRGLPSIQLSA